MNAPYHCSHLIVNGALRFPCKSSAVVLYRLPDGAVAGWCESHRREPDQHAQLRKWERVEQVAA